jgi:LPS export ABC transporter protein LptC
MLQFTQIKILKIQKVLSTFVLGTFVFFGLGILTSSCGGNSMDDIELISSDGELLPLSTSRNIKALLSDSGNVKITMEAPLVERFTEEDQSPYNVLSEGMRVEFLDSLGNVDAQVTCEHALHYPDKDLLILTKNVEVFNIDGDRLNSEYLVWNAKTKKITSNDFVKITTGDEIIYGDGFEADQDFTNYQIKNIKGIISVDDEDI